MTVRNIKAFAPFLLIAFSLAIIVGLAAHQCSTSLQNTPDPYEPLTLREFKLEPAEFLPGQQVTLTDGLCNTSDDLVVAQFWLMLIQEDTIFMADPIYVVPTDSNPDDEVVPARRREPIKAGECLLEEALKAPAPQWAPGLYHLFVDILVQSSSGEEQRIQALSNSFRVLRAE